MLERMVKWAERGLETLWLLAVLLVPLAFFPREYLISESELAYVDLPKTALLRSLAALMAMLWLLELGLQGRFPFRGRFTIRHWPTGLGAWLREQPSQWLTLAVLLYLASVLISTVLSVSFRVSMWGLIPGQDTYPAYTITSYALVFGLVAVHLRARAQLDRLLGCLILMGALVSSVAALQHYEVEFLGLRSQFEFVHATMGNKIPAGSVLLMTISITLLRATIGLGSPVATRRCWSKAALWTLLLSLQMLGIIYVDARGPWVGTLVSVVGFLVLVAVFTGWRTAARGSLVLGIAVLLAAAILLGQPQLGLEETVLDPVEAVQPEVLESIESSQGKRFYLIFPASEVPAVAGRAASIGREVKGGGLSSRVEIWKVSWRLARHHPWVEFDLLALSYLRPFIGYGPDLFKYSYLLERRPFGDGRQLVSNRFAHNFFVHNAVELGGIGFLTSVGIYLSLFAVGGYQLLVHRNRYVEIHKVMLAGLLAVVAGRFMEQSVGVASVSDFTVFWILLAIFVALPKVMESHEPSLAPAAAPSSRLQHQDHRLADSREILSGWVGWHLALVACLIVGIGILTWVKTVNYPLAAVKARQGQQELLSNDLSKASALLSQAIALAPDVAVYRNLQAAVYRGYQVEGDGIREPECARFKETGPYQTCLARKSYFSDLEATRQRPLEWSGRLAAADSAWRLGLLEGDIGLAREAIRLFEEAAELDPQSWWKWELIAAAYIEIGEPEAALEPLGKSLAVLDGISRAANTLVLRGMAYRESGDRDRALREFKQAIILNPALPEAHSNLGVVYSELGMYQRTIDSLDAAIKLDPEFALAYNNRGNAHGNLGRTVRAVEDYDEAIRLDSRLLLAYANRALAYTYLGRDNDARMDIENGIELGLDAGPILAKIEEVKIGR